MFFSIRGITYLKNHNPPLSSPHPIPKSKGTSSTPQLRNKIQRNPYAARLVAALRMGCMGVYNKAFFNPN